MNPLLNQLKSIINHVSKDVADLFTLNSKNIHLKELVPLITNHKSTIKTERELLALTFNTYEINFESLTLILETKGKQNQQILEVSIRTKEQIVFSYKSYEGIHLLAQDIPLPKNLLQYLAS
ncbi:hypothetical protein [Bacillus solitudinis]|uniref:hypothetical protein n=1 Tax=Bacillus solitudinis TaxID=2014074 RepID=UPI000C2404B0|nr:hypothetical protein [Bacillus solitudinis]